MVAFYDLCKKQTRVGWLIDWVGGDNLLLRHFGPYGIIFVNGCVVITVAIVMLLKDFGPYRIIHTTMYVDYFRFSRVS
jgi:hypothetical protein